MAAVLACGQGAALSHASAAALWELRRTAPARIDVSVPTAGGRAHRPIRVHRAATLRAHEATVKDAIPVTTPARTILDLAATLPAAHLENVLNRMEFLRLADHPALAALARAHPGHHGAHKLLATLGRYDAEANLTRSDLEILFRQICKDHALPEAAVNTMVEGKEVDFFFRAQRLIVEADSWRYHRTRRAFEDDRARDVLTTRAGYRTLRFTDRQLTDDPHSVAAASQASPSGDAIVGSTLYVAALQGQCLIRIPIEGTRLGTPTRLLAGRFGRLRTVAKTPDGSLWVMTSNRDGRGQPRAGDDKIIRVAI